jgi:hypothetical protein
VLCVWVWVGVCVCVCVCVCALMGFTDAPFSRMPLH